MAKFRESLVLSKIAYNDFDIKNEKNLTIGQLLANPQSTLMKYLNQKVKDWKKHPEEQKALDMANAQWKAELKSMKDWRLINFMPNMTSGYSGTAFKSPAGEIVIVNRGTEPERWTTGIPDVVTDGRIFLSQDKTMIQQFQDAERFVRQTMGVKSLDKILKNVKLSFTGHSLGGGLAQYLAYKTNAQGFKATTFNAVGIGQILKDNKTAWQKKYPQITNYGDEWDIIYNTGLALGKRIFIKNDQRLDGPAYPVYYTHPNPNDLFFPMRPIENLFNSLKYQRDLKIEAMKDSGRYLSNLKFGIPYSHSLEWFLNDYDSKGNFKEVNRVNGSKVPFMQNISKGINNLSNNEEVLKILKAYKEIWEKGIYNIPSSLLNGASNIPGRASGGPVNANSPYIVGENGQELFIPWTNGCILSNTISKALLNNYKNAVVNQITGNIASDKPGKILQKINNNDDKDGHQEAQNYAKSIHDLVKSNLSSALTTAFKTGDVSGAIKSFAKNLGDSLRSKTMDSLSQAIMNSSGGQAFQGWFGNLKGSLGENGSNKKITAASAATAGTGSAAGTAVNSDAAAIGTAVGAASGGASGTASNKNVTATHPVLSAVGNIAAGAAAGGMGTGAMIGSALGTIWGPIGSMVGGMIGGLFDGGGSDTSMNISANTAKMDVDFADANFKTVTLPKSYMNSSTGTTKNANSVAPVISINVEGNLMTEKNLQSLVQSVSETVYDTKKTQDKKWYSVSVNDVGVVF